MSKVVKKPSTVLFPVPAVLVTSCREGERPNVLTIAWTGILNSEPPLVYIGVRPVGRFSYPIIKDTGEYVINIPSEDQVRAVDYCGITSGQNIDKFAAMGLTPVPASQVKAPLIAECPVNLECRVRQVMALGSHDVFIADVLAVHYNEEVLNDQGQPDLDKIRPYGFFLNEYRGTKATLGRFGFSAKDK